MPRAPTDRLCPVPIIPDQSQGRLAAAPDFELVVGDEQPASVAHKMAEYGEKTIEAMLRVFMMYLEFDEINQIRACESKHFRNCPGRPSIESLDRRRIGRGFGMICEMNLRTNHRKGDFECNRRKAVGVNPVFFLNRREK